MLRRLLLQWFWDTYDALGRLVVLNLLLFTVFLLVAMLVVMPALSLTQALGSRNPALGALLLLLLFTLAGAGILTLWFPGLLYFSWQVSQDKEFKLGHFFRGLRQYGGRFLRLSLLGCLVLGMLVINIWFYRRGDLFGGSIPAVGAALAGLCFWIGLLALGIFVNAMPLVVRGERTLKAAIKIGAYVTLKYPLYTYGALLFLGLLWLLSAVLLKTAPLWIIGLAATVTYVNSMHDVVVWWEERKEKEEQKAREEAEGSAKPTSWKQIRQDEEAANEPKDRYQRTLRDILKPWE